MPRTKPKLRLCRICQKPAVDSELLCPKHLKATYARWFADYYAKLRKTTQETMALRAEVAAETQFRIRREIACLRRGKLDPSTVSAERADEEIKKYCLI